MMQCHGRMLSGYADGAFHSIEMGVG